MTRFTGRRQSFEFSDGTSFKYWRCYYLTDAESGREFGITQWGRIGTTGQAKFHLNQDEIVKKIQEKERKGYEYSEGQAIEADRLEQLNLPHGKLTEFYTMLRGRGQAQPVAVAETVDIAAEAQRLITETIDAAHTDQADAVVKLHDLNSTVAALEAQLEQARGGQEIAEAVVRKALK